MSIKYSEIFRSIQGEGPYTGRPTIWFRSFLCNLQCDGFGQKDPTDPTTYELPYQTIDLKDITSVEELPVFSTGCDSSYSWSAKFKKLQKSGTPKQIVDKFEELLPTGKFGHSFDLCFTGGEPLMPKSQLNIMDILDVCIVRKNIPKLITFETNGTHGLTHELMGILQQLNEDYDVKVVFSISPKLHNTSGELNSRAIKPNAIVNLMEFVRLYLYNCDFYFKFVCNEHPATWSELEEVLDEIQMRLGSEYNTRDITWIMPVGATKESQENISASIADKAIELGYKVSARVHCAIWGNKIGT